MLDQPLAQQDCGGEVAVDEGRACLDPGKVGGLANTLLVLGVIGLLGLYPWGVLGAIIIANGLPEAAASAILVLLIVSAVNQIQIGRKAKSSL